MKTPKLFNQTDPFTSAYYFQDNMSYLEVIAEKEILNKKEVVHLHDELEFILIFEGEGILHVNGLAYPVVEDCLIFMYPFHVHALEPKPGTILQYGVCRFPLSLIVYLNISKQFAQTEISILEYAQPSVLLKKEECKQAREVFRELIDECATRDHGYDMALLSCILRLIVIHTRHANEIMQYRKEEERPIAWNALQYIQMHFHLNIDTASVGELFSISARQLNSTLRLLTGMNFSKNLALVRIRNACAMMQFSNLSLSFIARATGYTSMPTFFRQFKEIKGITPAQYRENMLPGSQSQLLNRGISDHSYAVIYYVNAHYRESITISDAAKELYLSESTISTSLENNLGITFSQFVTSVRLWTASGLLLSTDLTVFDIAIVTGFNSLRTFNREFRLEFGTTPTAFRKNKGSDIAVSGYKGFKKET